MHGMENENVLLVSDHGKDTASYATFLEAAAFHQITISNSCDEARELLRKQNFDIVVVNSPLQDESGENFSRYVAGQSIAHVILIVKTDLYESISSACEEDGVLTIAKPVDQSLLWGALSLIRSMQKRLKIIKSENTQLKQNIEDIRIIDRAKLILISALSMTEQEAHRYIEKQAMDIRSSRRFVAEGILKRYEN
jgi:response regulator NasT